MADRRLGIFLGRDSAEAAYVLVRRRRAPKVLSRARAEAASPLWENGHAGLKPLFRKLAKGLPSEARRAGVRVALSLPDPLVSEDRLGFRDLPSDASETRELILWRLAREHRKPSESLACAWQVERVVGDEARVLVRIIDRDLLDAVTDAAGAAGFFPSRIDGWSGFAINAAEHDPAGAFLWANDDWWSLMCWARGTGTEIEDETLVHAEWRGAEAAPDSFAKKAARLAKSFARANGAEALAVRTDLPAALSEAFGTELDRDASLTMSAARDASSSGTGGAERVALDTP